MIHLVLSKVGRCERITRNRLTWISWIGTDGIGSFYLLFRFQETRVELQLLIDINDSEREPDSPVWFVEGDCNNNISCCARDRPVGQPTTLRARTFFGWRRTRPLSDRMQQSSAVLKVSQQTVTSPSARDHERTWWGNLFTANWRFYSRIKLHFQLCPTTY